MKGRYRRELTAILEREAPRLRTLVGSTDGGAGPAPDDALYLTLQAHADLTVERVFTPGFGLTPTDGGAGGAYALVVNQAMIPAWTGLHTFAAGLKINDDQTLIFGTDNDGTIEYDENGTNQVRVAGADWIFEPNIYVVDDFFIGVAVNDLRVEFDLTDGDVMIGLGDAAGADEFQILDSGDAVVAYVDSDGNADFAGHGAVGDNASVSAAIALNVDEIFTDNAGANYAMVFRARADPTAGFTTITYGVSGSASLRTAQVGTNVFIGVDGRVEIANGIAGTLAQARGGYFTVDAEDGTITNARSAQIDTPYVDTGSITNGDGLRIRQGTVGAGSIAALFGIRIDNISAGNTNWAIFTGTGNIHLGDLTSIGGIVTPLAQLHVDQSGPAVGVPAIIADQGDVSEPILQVTSDGADATLRIIVIDQVTLTPEIGWDNPNTVFTTTHGLTVTGTVTVSAGVTFNGASGANIVTIPDNTAQALNLVDVGGLEYLRVISTDAQPIVYFNQNEDDIDFIIGATETADAFKVQGSDGDITLGALGAGFVQSDAGGLLSSAALIAGDLPAHGTTHDVGAADPVTTSSNPGANARILASDAAGRLQLENLGVGAGPIAAAINASKGAANDAIVGTATGGGRGVAGSSVSGIGMSALSATGTGLQVNLTGAGTAILAVQDNGAAVWTFEDGGNLLCGATGTLDLNGVADALILSAAGTTSISDPTGGQIDFEILGADDFTMTANAFNVLVGSSIIMGEATSVGIGPAAERIGFYGAGRIAVMGANFGVGTLTPGAIIDAVGSGAKIRADATVSNPAFQLSENGMEQWGLYYDVASNYFAIGETGVADRFFIEDGGNIGIATSNPGQIFDVNQGSGNMIADGYDTHSLAMWKENLTPITGAGMVNKLKSFNLFEWTRTPFVSTAEVVALAIEHFDIAITTEFSPRVYYDSLALDDPICLWIDEKCKQLREERAHLPEWTRKHSGLVADDPATMAALGNVIGYDDEGSPTGYSLNNHVGFLHAVILDLVAEVEALKAAALH